MGIEIKINASVRIRQLKAENPFMTPGDIADLTGYKINVVNAALGRPNLREKPKSKAKPIEARAPLTAGDAAEKLRIPLEHARRVTGG